MAFSPLTKIDLVGLPYTLQQWLSKLVQSVVFISTAISSGLSMSTGKLLGRTTASSGAIEEISVGTGLSLSGGSLSSTVNVNYSQIATHTVSGSEAAISFTGISKEDILIYVNGLTADSADTIQMQVSINNGSAYGTARQIMPADNLSATAIYLSIAATGMKIGNVVVSTSRASTTISGINSGGSGTSGGAQFTVGAQINAIKFTLAGGNNFNGGILTVMGR